VGALGWVGLAATTFGAAVLQAAGGFGFAVVATPLYLMLVAPAVAVHLVIIIATALSLAVLPRLRHAIAPALLMRLLLGSGFGMPLGLVAFRYGDPHQLRIAAGMTVLGFALLLARQQWRRSGPAPIVASRGRDLTAGIVSGAATALVGMAGPPVLIYLLLAGAASQLIRATLLAFFALVYSATLAAHAATVGVPEQTWVMAAAMLPFALFGGLVGRPLGDRLGAAAFTRFAIGLLAIAGLLALFV
jgi:uncharacterized membrane protein YfcA